MATDVLSPKQRSAAMRAVKSVDTTPERTVAAALRALRLGFAAQAKELPGSPDFVFRRARLAVFVHGCFWHGHGCPRGRRTPKTNVDYWAAKIARNKRRDAAAARALRRDGWSVTTVWECRLKRPDAVARRLARKRDRLIDDQRLERATRDALNAAPRQAAAEPPSPQ